MRHHRELQNNNLHLLQYPLKKLIVEDHAIQTLHNDLTPFQKKLILESYYLQYQPGIDQIQVKQNKYLFLSHRK